MADYFLTKNEKVYVNVPILRIYIPKSYEEKEVCEFVGDAINTTCIFHISIHKNEKDKGEFKMCLLPIYKKILFTNKYEISANQIPQLEKDEEYYVLENIQDSLVMEDNFIVGDYHSLYGLIQLLLGGKLPKSISYDKITSLIYNCADLNGLAKKFNPKSMIFESVVSEFVRDPNDVTVPLRLKLNKNKNEIKEEDLKNFQYISDKNLPHIKSTYSSITFENFFKALVFSVKRSRYNEKEASSPIEKLVYQ